MMLYEFPDRFSPVSDQLAGSIDGLTWFSSEAVGTDDEAVPGGAALFVRGWAPNVTVDGPATNVIVLVDGVHKHRARAGLARPDVAEHFANERLHSSGFEALVTTGRLTAGEHRLEIFSVDPETWRCARLAETKTFAVDADWSALPQPFGDRKFGEGNLDEVRDESRARDLPFGDGVIAVPRGTRIWLRGWFCDPSGIALASDAFVLIDGVRAFPLEYGSPRPDVAGEFPNATSDAFGFAGDFSTAGLRRGRHTLEIVGLSAEAIVRTPIVYHLIVGQAANTKIVLRETTAAFIDDIVRVDRGAPRILGAPLRVVRGDRLFVRGWAIDSFLQGAAAGAIVVIDGDHEFPLLYGLPRPDIADAFGGAACLYSGFSGEIDTSVLPPGPHVAECRVLAGDGRGVLATLQRFNFEAVDG